MSPISWSNSSEKICVQKCWPTAIQMWPEVTNYSVTYLEVLL